MSEVLAKSEVMPVIPKSVWLRVGNCETPGRFKVVVEVNGGEYERVVYDSIDECDGNISQHTNLAWLIEKPSQKVEGESVPYIDEQHLYNMYEAQKTANDRNMAAKFEAEKEIADLKSQLEQAKEDKQMLLKAIEKKKKDSARTDRIIGDTEAKMDTQYETIFDLREQLTQAQAEKIEAAKDAARYADLFYKAQAEACDEDGMLWKSRHWSSEQTLKTVRAMLVERTEERDKAQAELAELKRYHKTWDVRRAMKERDQFQAAALSFRKTVDRYREALERYASLEIDNRAPEIAREALAEKEV